MEAVSAGGGPFACQAHHRQTAGGKRRTKETPLQTAARLREQHGVKLDAAARQPLPREAYDELWES